MEGATGGVSCLDFSSTIEALTDCGMAAHLLSRQQPESFVRLGVWLYVVRAIVTLCWFELSTVTSEGNCDESASRVHWPCSTFARDWNVIGRNELSGNRTQFFGVSRHQIERQSNIA